jgi:hypothetical protein
MDNLEDKKWDIRTKAQKKVTVDGHGNIEGSSWGQVKQYQKEFQEEFCPSCFCYDPKKKCFKEKGHTNDPEDCKHHWTDIAGQCWNYQERKAVEAGLEWIKEEEERRKKNPIITLSSDPKSIQQLKLKLLEYNNRLDHYKPPEAQMSPICKIAVLSRLLEKGHLNTLELMAEMEKTYGSGFNKGYFLRACAVIEDYCLTGGANLNGGTGLPKI